MVNHMSDLNKRDELLAKAILTEYFNDRYANLTKAECPDLQDCESRIGVEAVIPE